MMTIGLIALDLDGTLLDSQKTCQSATAGHWSAAPVRACRLYRPRAGQWMVSRRSWVLPGVNYAISTNGGTVADLVKGTSLEAVYAV